MTKRKVHSGSRNHHHRRNHNRRPAPDGSGSTRNDNYQRPDNNGNRRFSGVLPDPQILQEYEYATEGSVKRIFEMAELEQDHRNEWEDEFLSSYKKSMRIGQLFGFVLFALIVLCVTYLSDSGHDQVATVLAISAFSAAAVASIFGSASRRHSNRKPKRQE